MRMDTRLLTWQTHTRGLRGIRGRRLEFGRCTYTTFPSSLMVVLMSWDGARKQTTDSRSAISAIIAAAATLNIWWWRNRQGIRTGIVVRDMRSSNTVVGVRYATIRAAMEESSECSENACSLPNTLPSLEIMETRPNHCTI